MKIEDIKDPVDALIKIKELKYNNEERKKFLDILENAVEEILKINEEISR